MIECTSWWIFGSPRHEILINWAFGLISRIMKVGIAKLNVGLSHILELNLPERWNWRLQKNKKSNFSQIWISRVEDVIWWPLKDKYLCRTHQINENDVPLLPTIITLSTNVFCNNDTIKSLSTTPSTGNKSKKQYRLEEINGWQSHLNYPITDCLM